MRRPSSPGATLPARPCVLRLPLDPRPRSSSSSPFASPAQVAAGVVHGATPLFRSSAGIHGGVSLLAGLAACGIVGIWVLYLCGAKLRAKSRFTGGEAAEESGLNHVAEEASEADEQARGEAQA